MGSDEAFSNPGWDLLNGDPYHDLKKHPNSKKGPALLVGRTITDMEECIADALSSAYPAPTTLGMSFADFKGTVIATHTIKPWSHYTATVEMSSRVIRSAAAHPYRTVLGTTHPPGVLNPKYFIAEDVNLCKDFSMFSGEIGPNPNETFLLGSGAITNTGQFALWWVLKEGYDPVYVVGLDFMEWSFHTGWDEVRAKEIYRTYPNHDPMGLTLSMKGSRFNRMTSQAKWTIRKFPNTQVFRGGENMSNFPAPYKDPFGS
jgi:hypothetical protein